MSLLPSVPLDDGTTGAGMFFAGDDDGDKGATDFVGAVSRDTAEGFGLFRPKKIPALMIKAQMTATDGHIHRSSAD